MTAGQKRLAVVVGAAMAVAVGVRTAGVTLRAQTAWESYKNRKYPPSVDKHLTDPALIGAIDLHAHSDPDSYPRSWDGFEVAKLAQERGMRGVVLKNHWTETAGLAYLARKYATPGFEVFGAVSLDTPVGGVNPQAVRYMADVVGHLGRIVWMPTHDSEPEVKAGKENRPFVAVSREGQLLPEVLEVLVGHRAERSDAGHRPRDAGGGVHDHARSEEAGRPADDRHAPAARPRRRDDRSSNCRRRPSWAPTSRSPRERSHGRGPAQAHAFEAIRKVGPAMCFVSSDSGSARQQPSRCAGAGGQGAARRRLHRERAEHDVQGQSGEADQAAGAVRTAEAPCAVWF